MKRINTRRIKAKISYPVVALAELVGAHPNTVNNWVKHGGLPRVAGVYPHLIHGQDAIDFFNVRQKKNKTRLLPDEFNCMKCRVPRKALDGMATIQIINTKKALLRAVCECCKGKLNRFFSPEKITEIEKIFVIQQLHPSALVQSTNINPNTETKGV